ncbi:MAG: type 4a pilus biogenesis protein PilO [Candidatus Colwellbacteria bacterium]|nr:type 4a pilus biogenesis protein PilO [Candidatus Colwellbacteria bacterium]
MTAANKRLLSVLLTLGFFIGAVALYSSLVVPAYKEVSELRAERQSMIQLVEEERAVVEAINRLLSQYQSISDFQRGLSLVLPVTEDVPGIVNQLQGIAKTNGVAMDSLNLEVLALEPVKGGNVADPLGQLRVDLTLRGDYTAIKAYLAALATNIRIMDVGSLKITGGGTSNNVLNYNLTVETYYQR